MAHKNEGSKEWGRRSRWDVTLNPNASILFTSILREQSEVTVCFATHLQRPLRYHPHVSSRTKEKEDMTCVCNNQYNTTLFVTAPGEMRGFNGSARRVTLPNSFLWVSKRNVCYCFDGCVRNSMSCFYGKRSSRRRVWRPTQNRNTIRLR